MFSITLDTPLNRLNWENTRENKTWVSGHRKISTFSHLIKAVVIVVVPPTNKTLPINPPPSHPQRVSWQSGLWNLREKKIDRSVPKHPSTKPNPRKRKWNLSPRDRQQWKRFRQNPHPMNLVPFEDLRLRQFLKYQEHVDLLAESEFGDFVGDPARSWWLWFINKCSWLVKPRTFVTASKHALFLSIGRLLSGISFLSPALSPLRFGPGSLFFIRTFHGVKECFFLAIRYGKTLW